MIKKSIFLLFIFTITLYSGDTITTSSGLKYIVLKHGRGKKSEAGKIAEVHYTGWLTDGKKFDSSKDRNETFEFTLGAHQVIAGWDEGVALMRIGDKFRLIIPPDLGYGDKGAGEIIPPGATLIFDVDLISVHKAKKSFLDTLMTITMEKNVKKAVDVYYSLKEDYEDDYNFKESQLNILGYQLVQAGRTKDAIEIFKLNVEEFPDAFNTYDSLGEGYMMNGDTKLAIKNYKISLKLNPDNDNAKKMLEQLEQK
jgi:FKBP-type peptidyl-prolyl cis-trans isomerase 2